MEAVARGALLDLGEARAGAKINYLRAARIAGQLLPHQQPEVPRAPVAPHIIKQHARHDLELAQIVKLDPLPALAVVAQ